MLVFDSFRIVFYPRVCWDHSWVLRPEKVPPPFWVLWLQYLPFYFETIVRRIAEVLCQWLDIDFVHLP